MPARDVRFDFPGYGEGSFSGDLAFSANSANNYQRMPHIVTTPLWRICLPRGRTFRSMRNPG